MSPAIVGEPLERRAVISGIGQSQIGRRLGRSDIDLTVEAALAASGPLIEVHQLDYFRPSRPTPTHRVTGP